MTKNQVRDLNLYRRRVFQSRKIINAYSLLLLGAMPLCFAGSLVLRGLQPIPFNWVVLLGGIAWLAIFGLHNGSGTLAGFLVAMESALRRESAHVRNLKGSLDIERRKAKAVQRARPLSERIASAPERVAARVMAPPR